MIGTPGRLQHTLQKAPEFNVKKLELLILDEADRLLDMGFQQVSFACIVGLFCLLCRALLLAGASVCGTKAGGGALVRERERATTCREPTRGWKVLKFFPDRISFERSCAKILVTLLFGEILNWCDRPR